MEVALALALVLISVDGTTAQKNLIKNGDFKLYRDGSMFGKGPVKLNFLHHAPLFCLPGKWRKKSGFEMCFGPRPWVLAPWVLGAKHVSNPE